MSTTSEAPQDSVLRRHWEAARQVQPSMAASSAAVATNNASSSGGGFFLG